MIRNHLLLLVILVGVLSTGCVRRRMTIRSSPPGAIVYVDDQEIGTTPVSTSYTYYGTRKIQLVKDGYESMTQLHEFSVPWYEIPPLDFFSENLWPGKIRDERIVQFELEPQAIVPTTELLGRASQLRETTQAGYTVPTPPTVGREGVGHSQEPVIDPGAISPVPAGEGAYPPPFYSGQRSRTRRPM